MIKYWNCINTKFDDFFLAGRALKEYSNDSINYFTNEELANLSKKYSTKFSSLKIHLKSSFIGFNPSLLKAILDIAVELPICCRLNNSDVLYVTNEETEYLPDLNSVQIVELEKIKINNELWLVNDASSLASFSYHVQESLYKSAIDNQVYVLDKQSVYFSHDTVFGKNVIIEPNVYFGKNVVIEDNVTIKSFSHLEGVKLRNNVSIGPFARIRPDSEIGPDAKIGNFVEIKNSVLGKGSKTGHLAYIGDSNVGKNVNIGAGVVTCNYDGKKKHKTKIGDNSFVGTNTSIIAPINIGSNSLIGAGSFINKDVPDGHFAVGRSSQKNKLDKRKLDN